MTAALTSTCLGCGLDACTCDEEWRDISTRAPGRPYCPCCGEDTWCAAEQAQVAAEVAAAPELVMGAALYGGRS